MSFPLVSIIIPTFNREKDLERALNSVLSQTYANWEVCIVDNNSTDNSINLIKSYKDSRLKVFKIQNNGIIASSRNLGIENAKGKYIAFLDSDDWWSVKKLEKSVKYLEKKNVCIIYHDLYIVNRKNQKIFLRKTKSRNLFKPIFNDLIVNGNTLNTSSVVVRRDIFNKVSGFNENKEFIAIEDYDAWLNLSIINENFVKIPMVLGFYWLGGENTSNPKKTIKTLNSLENKFQEKIIELNLTNQTYWISYSRARAYFKLKNMEMALLELHSTLKKNPKLFIKFKVVAMVCYIKINRIIKI